jgi:anti-sigma factor RsiW
MRRPRSNRFREEELAALADGSLREDRSDAIEAHVAGSPELQSRLDEQRRALELIDAAGRRRRGARRTARARRSRAAPAARPNRPLALATGFAVAAAAAVVLVLTLPRGVGGPDFAEAATLGTRPAAGSGAAAAGG